MTQRGVISSATGRAPAATWASVGVVVALTACFLRPTAAVPVEQMLVWPRDSELETRVAATGQEIEDADGNKWWSADFGALAEEAFVTHATPLGMADDTNWQCQLNRHDRLSDAAYWPHGQDLLVRRLVVVPAGASALVVRASAWPNLQMWIDGQEATATTTPPVAAECASKHNFQFRIDSPDAGSTRETPTSQACQLRGRGGAGGSLGSVLVCC